jgi:hypothetical protein
MSTLLRTSESKPVSVFGRLIPSRLAQWIVRLWIIAIVVGSLLPGPSKERLGASTHKPVQNAEYVKIKHRVIHAFAFGTSCFLVSLLACNRREEFQAAGETMAVGFLVELAQDMVYAHGRVLEWWDVRDHDIGITVVFLAIQLIHRIQGHRFRVVKYTAEGFPD